MTGHGNLAVHKRVALSERDNNRRMSGLKARQLSGLFPIFGDDGDDDDDIPVVNNPLTKLPTVTLPLGVTSSTAHSSSSSSSSKVSSTSSSSSSKSSSSSSSVPATSTHALTTQAQLTTSQIHTTASIPHTTLTSITLPSSSAPAASAGGGLSTGKVMGGLAGAALAIAVVVMAIRLAMRRQRKREMERGFNQIDDPAEKPMPRPPSVIGRRMEAPLPPAPAYGGARPGPSPYYTGHGGPQMPQSYGNQGQYGYGAGMDRAGPYGYDGQMQQMQHAPAPYLMANVGNQTPRSAVFTPSAYGPNPFTPAPGSTPVPYNAPREEHRAIPPALAAGPVLTRQGSGSSQSSQGTHGAPPLQNPYGIPGNDYVDLNRSSVSPFQAAQYVEISRKLNVDAPRGLDTQSAQLYGRPNTSIEHEHDLPPPPPQKGGSPFADPARDSVASSARSNNEYPEPPLSSHSRVDSKPPTLPEINVESRVSVTPSTYDFPLSARESPMGSAFTNKFPASPSPLHQSTTSAAPHARAPAAEAKRPETVYDLDDAYGGF